MTRPIHRFAFLQELAAKIAPGLDQLLQAAAGKRGMRVGFVILIFDFNDHGGPAAYASNATRESAVEALREAADAMESDAANEEPRG